MDKLTVDIDALTKNFNKKLDDSIEKMKSAADNYEKLGDKMMIVTGAMLVAGGAAIKYASDLSESMNKAEVTFGKNSEFVKSFAKDSLTSFGVAEGSALDMAAKFGDMATSMGLNQQQAAGMSTKLVGLAADLSSFKNIKLDVANTALTGIFTGETESLKGLGIVMTEANLKTFALAQGMKKSYDEMSEGEKVALRYGFVMDKTKNSQGDFARTGGGAANQMRIFTESLKQLSASFGEVILPIFTKGITIVNGLIQAFAGLSPEMKQTIVTVAAITATVGPLLVGFAKIKSAILTLAPILGTLSAPVIAIGAAVIILTATIIRNWDSIKQTLINTGMWSTLTEIVDTTLGIVMEVFGLFGNLFTGNWSGLWDNITNILKGAWNGIINIAAGAVKLMLNIQSKLFSAVGLTSMSKGLDKFITQIDGFTEKFKFNTDTLTNNATKLKKTFSGLGTFDWKTVTGNGAGGIDDEKNKASAALYEMFKKIKEVKIKGYKDLEIQDANGRLINGEKIISDSKLGEQVATIYENLGYNVSKGAESLQNKLNNIKINMPANILSTNEEVSRDIEYMFDSIKEKYGNIGQNTFSLLGTQITKSIADGMKPDEAIEKVYENFQKIVEKIKEVMGENVDVSSLSSIGDKILTAMLSGMSVENAGSKILDPIKQMSDSLNSAIMNTFSIAFDGLSELLTGMLTNIFSGGNVDFSAIAAGLLSSLGGVVSDLGKTALAIGLGLAGIKKSLQSLNPAAALAAGVGLLALGAVLKGAGNSLSKSFGSSGGSNAEMSSPSINGGSYMSYSAQRQQTSGYSNESYLRGSTIYSQQQRWLEEKRY